MFSAGPTLACKPFADRSVKPAQNKGFISVAQKVELAKLEVAYGNVGVGGVPFQVEAGQSVWVKAEHFASPWARAILKLPGTDTEIILVPYQEICLVGEL